MLVRLVICLALAGVGAPTVAKDPDCSGTDRWPTRSTLAALRVAGVVDQVDRTKTKTTRIASEKIGDDLYRQVHRITYTEARGK